MHVLSLSVCVCEHVCMCTCGRDGMVGLYGCQGASKHPASEAKLTELSTGVRANL